MTNEDVLAIRLGNYTKLSEEESHALRMLARDRVRRVGARVDLVREGERPRSVFLILSGWAYRYKTMEDGRRQIVSFLLPGDLCDLNNFVLAEMDHTISALTALQLVELPHERVAQICEEFPRIGRALWWHMLSSISMQRQWTVSLSRSALERIGHLFCELFLRLQTVGLTRGNMCDLPPTQTELAEATGLTPVHVNRTLQEMRAEGLIVLKDRILEIPDLARLQHAVLFTPNYLHLGQAEAGTSVEKDVAPAVEI